MSNTRIVTTGQPGRRGLLAALAGCAISCVGAVDGGSAGPNAPATTTTSDKGGRPPGSTTAPGTNPPGMTGGNGMGAGMGMGMGMGMDPGQPPAPTAGCAPAPGRIWALTPAQYLRTLQTLLPAAAAGLGDALAASLAPGNGFSNDAGGLGMTEPHVSALLDTAWQVASRAASGDLGQLAPCLATAAPDQACLHGFVTGFGARAFRRDLTADETTEMMAYLTKESTGDLKGGVRRFLMYLFTSPNFTFRTELGPEGGTGAVSLTGFERAQTLSYFLSDGPPDAELFAAARDGKLGSSAEIEAQTRRLLAKPEAASGYSKLFGELFETAAVTDADKDPAVFPDWKVALAADLAREGDAFVQQVLWGEDGKVATLLTAEFSMLNGALATYYGVAAAGPAGTFSKVQHKAGQRAGILTQAGHLAALAKNNDTDPVARGRFVRETLLCQPLPPPPGNLAPVPPPPDGKSTGRDRLAQHSKDASCAGCHTLMDPLGLAFETYDGIGRYRTVDVGKTIDASGKLTGAEPEGAPFANALELNQLLASSPTVGKCFVSTAFRYAAGRDVAPADSCTIDRLAARFATSGGDMRDLAVAITTDTSFFARQAR
jgi:hypothetical protein